MARADEREPTTEGSAESRIPTFETVEEEAAFWDSHSLADFEDELKIVTNVKFVRAEPQKAIRGQQRGA